MFGIRADMIFSGLRPATLVNGFRKGFAWKPDDDLSPLTVRGLRSYRADGYFSSFSDNLAANFFEVYLVAFGAGSREIGAMAAVANLLGFLALAPGVAAVRLLGRRLPVVIVGGGGIGRLMYLALALVPFFFPDPRLAVPAIIAFNGIRVFMGNFSNPAWTGMTADLVPERIRGSYFASRSAIIAMTGSIAALSSGYIVAGGNSIRGYPLMGFTLLFIATFASGMVATWHFSKVPDLGRAIVRTRRPLRDLVRGLLRYPVFIGFVFFTFLWNFALMIAGPFFNVYLVRDLGASPMMVGVVATVGNIVPVFALPYWGRRLDTKGDLHVLVAAGIFIPLLPFAWMLTRQPWHASVISAVGGFLWAGFNLGNFNLLLKMLPEDDRQEGAALYQGIVLLSTILGPVAGAEIAIAYGYRGTFAVSGLFRIIALLALYFVVVRRLRKN